MSKNVIMQQPGAPLPPGAPVEFMPAMQTIAGVPPGLEYLTLIDKLVIQQKKSLLEAVTSWEVTNKYAIYNAAAQQVYWAYEESGCCMRQCCANARGFTLHIVDNYQKEVLTIRRPFKCCACGNCCACCLPCQSEITVESPPGNVIGIVREQFGCCSFQLSVLNADESHEDLKISGPNMCSFNWCCNCCSDKVFEILAPATNQPIGTIRKKWTGAVKEIFTDADNFVAEFPLDLEVKVKATLLAATFLVDFLAFENNEQNGGGGGG
ncbi:unnamed protein product, partial [Mesorhabditis spiculigera]